MTNDYMQDDFPKLSRAAYAESDVLHAADLQQDGQSLTLGNCLHNAQAHAAGVVAGFHQLVIKKSVDGLGMLTIDAGAAVDSLGRMLLWDGSDNRLVEWPDTKELDIWIYQSDDPAAVPSGDENEQREADDSPHEGMSRAAAIIVFDVLPANKRPHAYSGHVYLGTYLAKTAHNQITASYASGRTYVGARGAEIESCSSDTRILLGPEQPRDMRRFAISCRDGATYENVLSWETNQTFNLHAPVSIERENAGRVNFEIERFLRFGGSVKAAEVKSLPWTMQMVEVEQDGRIIEELRITIAKPEDETLQVRTRCSLGRTTSGNNKPEVLQEGKSLGVLSILADGSVEVIKDLWVFADSEHGRPGLILKSKAKGDTASEPNVPQVLTNVLDVTFSATWSADKASITVVGRVLARQPVNSLRLFVTLSDVRHPNSTFDFGLGAISSAGSVMGFSQAIQPGRAFATDMSLEVLVLGITQDLQVAQYRGQTIPNTAAT